jgi:lysozyme
MRKINEHGLAIIKESEGCRLTVYTCDGGKRTIGYGHVLPDNTIDGTTVSQGLADAWLDRDVQRAARDVEDLVKVILTDNQFSALVSFVFNVGRGNFSTSTLLRKLNMEDYGGAANEFGKWVYAKGRKLNGLIIRRAKERSLFLEEI